jgi:amidase
MPSLAFRAASTAATNPLAFAEKRSGQRNGSPATARVEAVIMIAGRRWPGESAQAIAERVTAGRADPVEVVREHLEWIEESNPKIGAFERLRGESALEEAAALATRSDLATLPLAGVPIAIKDNVCVEGEPMRAGSTAMPDTPCPADHEVVGRLRAAGAIVIGITRVPELCIWATSDNAAGVARNPWDPERTPGGSSGGSAAAVAAGMVPAAHGNDGLGSIRIPAACCGLVGLKPGWGVVPAGLGAHSWFGMAVNGPLATTVTDAAILFNVMAGRPVPPEVVPPAEPLRIAVSIRKPLPGTPLDTECRTAAENVGGLLSDSRHAVEHADPPYPFRNTVPVLARWFAGALSDAELLDLEALEPRTRRQVKMGRLAMRLRLVRDGDAQWWRQHAAPFFERHDVLITPALATPPIPASRWSRKSWIANVASNTMYAPFAAPWNLAGYPAIVVPAGTHSSGVPVCVQLVAAPGREDTLLSVARQIEMLRPWTRIAPMNGPGAR